MKKIVLLSLVLSVVLASPVRALFIEDVTFVELSTEGGYYADGETEGEVGMYFSSEPGFKYLTKVSFQAVSGSLGRQGSDIFSRDGENPIFSLREVYVDKGIFRIGKQTFVNDNGIDSDFTSLNIFEVRDQSRPFSSLDQGRVLGSWGVSAKLFEDKFEVIAMLSEPLIIAMSSKNPWTRELPAGFNYGDVELESEYSVGLRWNDSVEDIDYEISAQRGSGNSPVDADVGMTGEVRPVIAEQTSASAAIQKPFGGFNLRLGLAGYIQEDYSDFIVGVFELERFWENIVSDGDSLFIDIGYADAWETASGPGIPELDLRRIYEGGTALVTAEYALGDWVAKIKGAYNFSEKGMYIAPEISWFASDSVAVSLRYEAIDGRSDSGPSTIWVEHSEDDNITLKLIFTF